MVEVKPGRGRAHIANKVFRLISQPIAEPQASFLRLEGGIPPGPNQQGDTDNARFLPTLVNRKSSSNRK